MKECPSGDILALSQCHLVNVYVHQNYMLPVYITGVYNALKKIFQFHFSILIPFIFLFLQLSPADILNCVTELPWISPSNYSILIFPNIIQVTITSRFIQYSIPLLSTKESASGFI